ncbi:glycoside hydrolase family 3 protein [Listeria rustica]|uniref:beta-N-acetylhexosaminidase n=1 Tax=Listeria rustica TaxID=2713503 RepID=A0A7W1YFT0_9LIST|nr:glycoside hydrolase family 3 protein [Listeria rustica]MBA3925908.1 glycoside hydrolase family 3 protein [Listeria rustica]
MTVDLTKKPFYLNESQLQWVENSIAKMSLEEKISQLFIIAAGDAKDKTLQEVTAFKAGGVMLRPLKERDVRKVSAYLKENSEIAPFLAANLETGSNGLIEENTNIGHEMLIAATGDVDNAYQFGKFCMGEARVAGGNMAFAPIIDINFNWENPITNMRSFGDDPDLVSQMGQAYVKGAQEVGGAVTIKHFPGDGVDGRDHHVVKSVNSLAFPDWMTSFGKVYQENIENGATGVMVGHISLPSYFNDRKDATLKDIPGSLNPVLIQDLLRGELGFNGLVMTDASLMAGFGSQGKRQDLLPRAIAAGNDMFLFTKNMAEDYQFMLAGYHEGVITPERLNEALQRILGLKARLQGYHEIAQEPSVPSNAFAKKVADEGVTLVKDTQNLLPLNPQKQLKIGIISLGNELDVFDILEQGASGVMKLALKFQKRKQKSHEAFAELLGARGYQVSFIDHSQIKMMMDSVKESIAEFTSKYDVIIYFVKKDTMSNQTNLRVEFKSLAGFDAPWFIHEIPTMLISVANPYHEYDFPDVMTIINGYSPTAEVLEAIVDKIEGKSAFKGISPVSMEFLTQN